MGFDLQHLRARVLDRLPKLLTTRGGSAVPQASEADQADGVALPDIEDAVAAPDAVGALMILDVVFSDYDWSLTVTNPISQKRIIERRDDLSNTLANDPSSRAGTLDSLRAAIRSLAPGERAQCGEVRLWPADPAIEVFDNRAVRAYGADRSSMTLLAERLMGAAECGFDSVPYGRRIENEAERRLISACQLDLARSYLAALGDLSTRIASIAPATLSWLAAPGESETKAVLHLGADSSLLVVSDASSGVVAQRHIRVGAHEYRFENDRLVATELDERTQQRQKANASKDKTADGKKAAKPPQKFLGLTLPQRGGAGSEITPLKLAALGVCGAGLIGFLALDFAISPAAARLARSGADYDAAQIRISALEAQLGKLRAAARQDAFSAAGADKILWAEKFAAIAEALPPSVWLTGAAIAKTDRRVGNIDVVTTKLVLHGVTRAESDQRLQDIAQFIQSLEEDQSFMRDFRRIVFAGLGAPASENATSAASGVTFEVHAWYDENKRKAMRDSAPAAATGLISTAAGTAAARAAVGARLDGQASDPALGLPTGARP